MVETPGRIEPCGIEEDIPEALTDLVVTIRGEASEVGRGLHPDSAAEIRSMTRMMNSYYSNLIEGHNTRPRDIEAAMEGRDLDEETRPLAEEALAHIVVQEWIDDLADNDKLPDPTSADFLVETHRRFYEAMPTEFRFMQTPDGQKVEVVPGALREHDVEVGQHLPPSHDRISAFMGHFETRYRGLTAGATGKILAIPAAHHRLNYIHPFADGNGRVSRLMSHAMVRRAGIGSQGLWSISRGLARGLHDRSEYMLQMDSADMPRRGDRDGRGNLSMSALKSFTGWFLSVMLDQVRFSRSVLDMETLRSRYLRLVRDVTAGDKRSEQLVDHVLRFGSMSRGDAELVLKVGERTARDVLKSCEAHGFLKSRSPKTPVRIAFPLQYRERIFPNLFAEAPIEAPDPPVAPRLP